MSHRPIPHESFPCSVMVVASGPAADRRTSILASDMFKKPKLLFSTSRCGSMDSEDNPSPRQPPCRPRKQSPEEAPDETRRRPSSRARVYPSPRVARRARSPRSGGRSPSSASLRYARRRRGLQGSAGRRARSFARRPRNASGSRARSRRGSSPTTRRRKHSCRSRRPRPHRGRVRGERPLRHARGPLHERRPGTRRRAEGAPVRAYPGRRKGRPPKYVARPAPAGLRLLHDLRRQLLDPAHADEGKEVVQAAA